MNTIIVCIGMLVLVAPYIMAAAFLFSVCRERYRKYPTLQIILCLQVAAIEFVMFACFRDAVTFFILRPAAVIMTDDMRWYLNAPDAYVACVWLLVALGLGICNILQR